MNLSDEERAKYNNASNCHICNLEFDEKNEKVRDHCHITGKFRGAAHNICNLKYKYPTYIPVIFHNLRGYDSHLILELLTI